MELPKGTLKHLGKLLREKTGAVVKKPLPARFSDPFSANLIPAGLRSARLCIGSGKGPTGRASDCDKPGTD